MDRVRQFREAADEHNHGRPTNRWRYPDALRRLAIEHWQDQNKPITTVARELGVGASSLTHWLQDAEASKPSALHPVAITTEGRDVEPTPPTAASGLSVTTPTGLRIDGLTLPQVVELAQVLR